MLQIILNKRFNLELPEGFSMQIIDENPLFIMDRIPVAHTINMEVQKTPANMLFFGFPDRPTTSKLFEKYEADIYHFGSLVMQGEMLIIEVSETINLQFLNAFMPDNVRKPMNQLDFGEQDFGTAQISIDDLDYTDPMYDDYKQAVSDSVFQPDEYITSPVRINGKTWEGHNAAWGLKNALNMYINYFNPIDQNWKMIDTSASSSDHTNYHLSVAVQFPIVPFPYVHVIIEKILGNVLKENPFYENTDLRKLVLVNFNHHNLLVNNLYADDYDFVHLHDGYESYYYYYNFPLADDYTAVSGLFQNKWKHNSFLQEYYFNDFFKNLLKLFGLSCFIGRKIELVYNNDLLDTDEIFDLSNFITNTHTIETERGKVYVLSYGEEKTKESKTEPSLIGNGSVAANFLHLIFYTTELTKQYKVEGNPNLVLEFTRKAVGVPVTGQDQKFIVESKIITPALSIQKYEPDEDDEREVVTVSVDVKPLEMNLEHFWNELFNEQEEFINKKHWYVPVINEGDIKAAPHIMFDTGLRSTVGEPYTTHNYRTLNNHHTDAYGNKTHNLSLLINPTDPDGVFVKYHEKMAKWYEQDKVKMIVTAILTATQIRNITNKMKIHINGKNFYILKREYAISNDRYIPVTFYLIEAFPVLSEEI